VSVFKAPYSWFCVRVRERGEGEIREVKRGEWLRSDKNKELGEK
jgi:hypothetical protein